MVCVIKECLLCIQSFICFHLRLMQVGWRRVKKGAMVINDIAWEKQREREREYVFFSLLSDFLVHFVPRLMGFCLLSCYLGCIVAHYSYAASVHTVITYARLKFNQIPFPACANQLLRLVIISQMFCNKGEKSSNETTWLVIWPCLLLELEFIYYSLAF